MVDEPKCRFHGLSRETNCNWCGEIMCIQCLEASYHKKYCPKCYSKLSKNGIASSLEKRRIEKPIGRITNIDIQLTEKELKQKREMLEIQLKAKKILREH